MILIIADAPPIDFELGGKAYQITSAPCRRTTNRDWILECFPFREFSVPLGVQVLQRFAKVQVKWEDQLLDTWHKLEQHFLCFRRPLCCHAFVENGRAA